MSRLLTIEEVSRFAYRCARRDGSPHHEAEDLAQDVAIKAIEHHPGGLVKSAWVARVTKNWRITTRVRLQRLVPVGLPRELGDDDDGTPDSAVLVAPPDPSPLPGEPDPELSESTLPDPAPYLRRLSVKQRAALLAVSEHGWKKAAKLLGVTEGCLQQRVTPARKKLRNLVRATETRPGARSSSGHDDL